MNTQSQLERSPPDNDKWIATMAPPPPKKPFKVRNRSEECSSCCGCFVFMVVLAVVLIWYYI